ncbi:MAG: hypothetical protein PHX04_03285 [Bacilli bacterium]|nr:hypothetical protein [Bacilli bacterium]
MTHYKAYDSFNTKKSIEKKEKPKAKAFGKQNLNNDDFIIKSSKDYGIVIEVKYKEVIVLYKEKLIKTTLRKDINMPYNKVLFPGDKVVIDKNCIIQNLLERYAILSRIKKDKTRYDSSTTTQIIATNINLAIIVVSANCKQWNN